MVYRATSYNGVINLLTNGINPGIFTTSLLEAEFYAYLYAMLDPKNTDVLAVLEVSLDDLYGPGQWEDLKHYRLTNPIPFNEKRDNVKINYTRQSFWDVPEIRSIPKYCQRADEYLRWMTGFAKTVELLEKYPKDKILVNMSYGMTKDNNHLKGQIFALEKYGKTIGPDERLTWGKVHHFDTDTLSLIFGGFNV